MFCPYGTLGNITGFGNVEAGSSSFSCYSDYHNKDKTVYYPPTCSLDNLPDTERNILFLYFEEFCLGRVSCSFPLTNHYLPDNCFATNNTDGTPYPNS